MIQREPGKQPREHSDWKLFQRILREAKSYRWHLVVYLLVSLLATPLALLIPVPLKLAVDSGLSDAPLPSMLKSVIPASLLASQELVLVFSAILLVVVAFATQVQSIASALLRTFVSERILLDFRGKLFRHVQRLSFSFHDSKGTSDSTYRIQWDATSIQYLTVDGIIPLVTAAFTVASMIYITFALDWKLGLVALTVSPVLVGLAQFYRPRLRSSAKELKNLESSAFSVIPEVLAALRVVKAFGQEDREHERFVEKSQGSLRAKLRYVLTECSMGLAIGMTTAAGTAVVLYVGARHVLSGDLRLGELLLVMSYTAQLYGPLKSISKKMATMQSHLASAERAFKLLDESSDVPEKAECRPIKRVRGDFTLENVSFAYEEGTPVLENVNLRVPYGTRVGIVGQTGAGKTTLISLLMRFYDVTNGGILLDGHDLRDYRIADLRNQFALVLQDPVLFSATIAENISYGRPRATSEDIIAAARAANAHEFIQSLSDGYDTQVGERGMRLSGGERQRISLARAFLKDAPVLVLDEPTSSVDVNTEDKIMEAMERLMEGRTTFMIAHRLSTLRTCDLYVQIKQHSLTCTPDGHRNEPTLTQ